MSRWGTCLSSKIYAFRKQNPSLWEFGKRIKEVERELNKDHSKTKSACGGCGNSMCDCCGKCGCNSSCKNRQKR